MAMLSVNGRAIKDPSEFTWGLQDISSENAGRTMDTTMHKNRVGQKVTLGLSWSMVNPSESSSIVNAFNPEYVDVTYFDPLANDTVTKTFYTGDKSAPVQIWTANKKYYNKISFNIIER